MSVEDVTWSLSSVVDDFLMPSGIVLLAKGAVEKIANDVGLETGLVRLVTANPECEGVGRKVDP